jgi:hypothetical protein
MEHREQRALDCVTRSRRIDLGTVDRRERAEAIGQGRTVLVSLSGPFLRTPVHARGLAESVIPELVTSVVAGVQQVAVGGASHVLHQEHVTGARGRQEHGDQAEQDTNLPNHW